MPGRTKAATAEKRKPATKKATTPAGKRKTPAKPRQEAPKKTAKQGKTRTALENLESAVDFCGIKLSAKRYAFLTHYLTPDSPYFHNARQSAIKAGYAENTANVEIYRMLQEPGIQKIVQHNERLAHLALHESAKRAIEIKQQRAFFDPSEYFEEKEITIPTKQGEITKTVMALKPMDKMTREQRMCIDGVDIKGQSSIPVYIMPDRAKELNDIIKIDGELSKAVADTSEEETREIIMERITIRETKRAQRRADFEYEIVEDPIEVEEDGEEEDNE